MPTKTGAPYALVKKQRDGWYYRIGSSQAYPWVGPFETQHVAERVREGRTGGPWGYPTKAVAGYSNYGGGGPFAPMAAPAAPLPPRSRKRKAPATKKTARAERPKRAAHATKKAGASDTITIAKLAEMFGLPDWDKIDEMNQQHYWEMSRGAEDEEEAEQEAQTEIFNKWYDAVEAAASKLFEEHDLELKPTGKQGTSTRSYVLKISPATSWNDAANKIRETINGVGDFHFSNLREFLASGPYTARQAVLEHLHYIKRHPAVYGGLGARQLYDQHWR